MTVDAGRVTGFAEKGAAGPGDINSGVYLLGDIFQGQDLGERFSFENDFLVRHIGRLRSLAFMAAGPFVDIGTPEGYRIAQTMSLAAADPARAAGRRVE